MTVPQSRKNATTKPSKPHPDFPLFAHANGQWAWKLKSKIYYFGPWRDPDAALKRYIESKDDILAGRDPRVPREGLTIRLLANYYLTGQHRKLECGDIKPRTMQDGHAICKVMVDAFGPNKKVGDIRANDFGRFRSKLAKTRGPIAMANAIQRIKTIFKFAYESELIDKPMRFGPEFKRPSARSIREARQAKPPRMFEPDEIHKILEVASTQIKAMVMLGINCGFGNSDCSELPKRAIDFQEKTLEFSRPKTFIERRSPLWPETIDALRAVNVSRPKAKNRKDAGCQFITKYGARWVKVTNDGAVVDAVGLEFGKILRKLNIKRPGLNFYALRHTFRTVADEVKDHVAVDLVMGHVADDLASKYRERVIDQRLKAVTDHVHDWLYGSDDDGPDESQQDQTNTRSES